MSIATLVREDRNEYIPHDQLFKQLIHTFFDEFLEIFFPEVHKHIDFSCIKPLSEEMFTDLYEGESRRADIVIETKLKGRDTLMIIHVEPQSYNQPNFNERMYHYFSLLYNKYRKPILPISIFSYDENRTESNEFSIDFPFFHVLTFNFLKLELRKMNWRHYIGSTNPAALALLSKMGYTKKEKVQVKKEFLRMLVKMEIEPAKSALIYNFFETYLPLSNTEEDELMEQINRLSQDESEQIRKLPKSLWEKGKEEGKEEGKKEDALEMLKEGLSIKLNSKITHLSKDEIKELRRKL
ncbi:transposase [Virgibacillus necropolis]|uniref:Rpn family recombination-promoting nuclease/putative transposase n=1 Tax=Virgibacillus necropolis TaxID=163877 RepID=UPI0038517A8D